MSSNTKHQDGCVLVRLKTLEQPIAKMSFSAAQTLALAKHVPLAMVFCLETAEADWSALLLIEYMLGKFNIPLLVLVGNPRKTLPALEHHTKPLAVFDVTLNDHIEEPALVAHPYKWPGTVIPVAQLRPMTTDLLQNGC